MVNQRKEQMMKRAILLGVVAAVMILSVGVGYAAFHKQIDDNGKHFNVNIIGVPNGKTADMDNTNGDTIFVPLDKSGLVAKTCKIYMAANVDDPDRFQIVDRNACDADGAKILVPFEYYGTLSYNVYAISLGKPSEFGVSIEATATFQTNTTADLLMDSVQIEARQAGKPKVTEISDIFRATGWIDEAGGTAGVYDPGIDIAFNNVWVFNIPTLLEYYWDYTTTDLRHMQLRFYETTSGSWTNAPTD
jgi:hypothetical protein